MRPQMWRGLHFRRKKYCKMILLVWKRQQAKFGGFVRSGLRAPVLAMQANPATKPYEQESKL